MDSRRPYLDKLNAGRERRANPTLEDISETLSALERQIGEARGVRQPTQDTRRPQAEAPVYRPVPTEGRTMRTTSPSPADIGRISTDLQLLRDELRREMSTGIKREFETLRTQLSGIYTDVRSGHSSMDIAPELERISKAVQSLAQRSSDRGVSELHLEVEELKHAVSELAREESLRAVHDRWSDFDRRWDSIQTHIMDESASNSRNGRVMDGLSDRLEAITAALSQLPSTTALHSLEDKVLALSGAVERIAQQQVSHSPSLYEMVEQRLDEISRAIVATSVANQPAMIDYSPIERIEARISSLTSQLAEVMDGRDSDANAHQIHDLTERVEALAANSAFPQESIERIAGQLSSIASHLSTAPAIPDMAIVLNGVEERILSLANMVEQNSTDVSRQSATMFRELDSRLAELNDRLELATIGGGQSSSDLVMQDLEQRFDELNTRLDASSNRQSESERALMQALDNRFREVEERFAASRHELESQLVASRSVASPLAMSGSAIESLEARLEEIATRLDATTRQNAGSDHEVIESLEMQIANLSSLISNPQHSLPDLDRLTPRLEEIEKALAGNQATILEVARAAAEDAIRSVSARDSGQAEAVAALADDLKELDRLARRTEERTTRTFEAIHETLLKVVDRMAQLETIPSVQAPASKHGSTVVRPARAPEMPKTAMLTVEPVPGMVADEDFMLEPFTGTAAVAPATAKSKLTPTEAAVAAALAAVNAKGSEKNTKGSAKPSLLKGLTKALKGKSAALAEEPVPVEPTLVSAMSQNAVQETARDVAFEDEILAPGSTAPDLNAIMDRVRSERGQTSAGEPAEDASKADFIAAARRAAQAAAAEAEVLKGRAPSTKSGAKFSPASLLQQKRKPILMAVGAIMVVVAGLQVGKTFLGESDEVASIEEPVKTAALPKAEELTSDPKEVEPAAPNVRVIEPEDLQDPALPGDAALPADVVPEDLEKASAPDAAEEPQLAATPTVPEAAAYAIDFGPSVLREAVAGNDPKAFYEVGSRYAEGRGVAANMEKSAEWIRRSAEGGFAPAQYRIGNYFEKGTGVERDIDAAKTWYQMAAEQGNASAMHNLAVLFANSPDGKPDYASASRWFLNAAELGVKDSQFNLGIMAAKGVGMAPDMEGSYKWFAVAARNGDKDAAAKRDEVAKAMRPEQLDRARAAADLWKPRENDAEANVPNLPAAWSEANETTASIDMKKAIRNIQLILNKNGYDAGKADGVMGGKTRQAIMDFQKANDLPATGDVDDTLIKMLLAKK